MKVQAKRSMPYGRKHYAAGDVIEMSERDAKLLTLIGRVEPAHEVQHEPAGEEHKGKGKKGTYKRRDMQAEDTKEGEA